MKRFALFLGGLLILPAFGEVAPVFYDEYDMEYVDYADQEYVDADDELLDEEGENTDKTAKAPVKISRQQTVSRNIANRSTASRTVPSSQSSTSSTRGKSSGNSARVVAARTTTNASPRANAARTVTSRTATTTATASATRAAATRATGGTRTGVTARTGNVATTAVKSSGTSAARTATAGARVSRAARNNGVVKIVNAGKTVNSANTVNSTTTLYNPNAASSRVGVRSSSSLRRSPVLTVTSKGLSTAEEPVVAADTSEMDELAELTDYCKSQYMACMDNYCNVLDENQGRCSCSANLKNYAKSEAALKQATEELQDVAQKIQYIGLSAREVETLFTQTEAEKTMQSKTDTTQLKTSLDKVKDMIIEARSGNSSSTSSGMSFDISGLLDFTIDSTGFDLSSFLGGFGSDNNVSNQRGEELFKTATNRCKANVLRACTAQGVDAATITNAYDLEIDKECIAYEKSLNDSNNEMTATVRNAKNVLQKARLMVAQSKNEYDMRGCINALDSCMQDEFVCGSDYENCLDPTGRYIVNGEIVVGSQPGHAIDPAVQTVVGSVLTSDVCDINLYRTWDFQTGSCVGYDSTHTPPMDQANAWGAGTNDTLAKYISETVTSDLPTGSSVNMSKYLQNKIGYSKKDSRMGTVNYGMCIGVLNKCQDYTYEGKGTSSEYKPDNDVIKQYLGRVLIQIKAKQDEILSEYAESCITDVQSCLSQNGYPTEEPLDELGQSQWTGTEQTQANIAVNACRATIVTCMSVNGYSIATPTPQEMNCWVMGLQFNTTTSECDGIGGGNGSTPSGTYTVTYNCNGGTGNISTQSVVPGSSVVLPSATACSKSGYTLIGWQCGSNALSPSSGFTPTATTVCRANWQINGGNQTITWNTPRGSTSGCPSNYTFSDSNQSVTCNVGSVSGWVFRGWCRTDNPSICSTSSNLYRVIIPGNWTQPISFTGTWEQLTEGPVWVTFNVNDQNCGANNPGCILDSDPRTLYYQTNRNIDDACPTGWYVDADCQSSKLTRLIDGPVSENANCVYQGHFNAASGGTQYIANDYKFNNNIPTSGGTLYAHWDCTGDGGDRSTQWSGPFSTDGEGGTAIVGVTD